jgi:hypothetical protein
MLECMFYEQDKRELETIQLSSNKGHGRYQLT